jgi:VanZ family protein
VAFSRDGHGGAFFPLPRLISVNDYNQSSVRDRSEKGYSSSAVSYRGRNTVVRYKQLISQASAWILLTTIMVLSLVPPQDRPVTSLPHLVEHLSIFLATGLVFGVGYPQRRLFQFVTLLAFAAAIELAQLLVPGRHARLSDFLIDALAMTVGLWIGFMAAVPGTRSE